MYGLLLYQQVKDISCTIRRKWDDTYTACINLADSLSMMYFICVDTSMCTSAGGVAGLLHGVLLYRPNDIGHTNGKCRVLGSSICTQDTTAQVIMFITPLD